MAKGGSFLTPGPWGWRVSIEPAESNPGWVAVNHVDDVVGVANERPGDPAAARALTLSGASGSLGAVPPDGSSGAQPNSMKTPNPILIQLPALIGCVCLLVFSSPTCLRAAAGDEHWSTQFGWPGSLENVVALRLHGGKLYYGGGVTGGTNASLNVFDGREVTRLGLFSGSSGTTIYDLMFVGETLYVGGSFTNVDGVAVRGMARREGGVWSATGFTNGTVGALALDGGDLYAAGLFTNPGGVALTNIGRWDGAAWHAVG